MINVAVFNGVQEITVQSSAAWWRRHTIVLPLNLQIDHCVDQFAHCGAQLIAFH